MGIKKIIKPEAEKYVVEKILEVFAVFYFSKHIKYFG